MTTDTYNNILNIAESHIKQKGYNAFSYKDIANELGIKTSSIHYHFATKCALALALVDRFVLAFTQNITDISNSESAVIKKLESFTNMFTQSVEKKDSCLCGMLISDIDSMTEEVCENLDKFTHVAEQWLTKTIQLGQQSNELKQEINPSSAAKHYLATIQGAMLLARSRGVEYFNQVMHEALEQIKI